MTNEYARLTQPWLKAEVEIQHGRRREFERLVEEARGILDARQKMLADIIETLKRLDAEIDRRKL